MPAPATNALLDGISTISKGMHSGISPRLLPPDQLAFAINVTCRNGLPRTRPVFHKVGLVYPDNTTQTNATKALFQCAHAYQTYNQGEDCIVASIGGHLFRYLVASSNKVQDISLASDLNSPVNPDAWMWQSEDFLIVNNGQKNPLFFDGASVRRSLGMAGQELPPGCMGAYVQGRNWFVLPGSSQKPSQTFMAGDLVYSHGYSDGYNGRRACLKTEENNLFSGGGAFSVPVSAGPITAMSSVAIADTSLGQGSLQVLTAQSVFSVQVPLLRTDWASTQYPLMTIGLPNYGAIGPRAITTVNGDLWYRSQDGIRSYQIARRDFNTWVNTPLSVEVEKILNQDDDRLLGQCNCVLFDNRWLVTCSPFSVRGRGTVHRGMVALDFNNVSNLTARSNPCYDGLWTGIQILQFVKGTFKGVERCFAFALDCNADICLYEILKDGQGTFDWDGTDDVGVESSIESRSLIYKTQGNQLLRLLCADLYLDKLSGPGTGTVEFNFKYRSDEDPFWQNWHSFSLCAPAKDCSTANCPTFADVREQYRTYLRLPEPTDLCSKLTHRMRRTGYEFQIRMWWKGYAQLNRLHVWTSPMSDSVVVGCPTSETCTVLPCEDEGALIPGTDELVGIITEPQDQWIVTEGGTVIRTEDQPQYPHTPNNPNNPNTPNTQPPPPSVVIPFPALPSYPPPPPYACSSISYWGPVEMQDTVVPFAINQVAINPGASDPNTYVATWGAPGCLQSWCQETWNQFWVWANANNVNVAQARFVWGATAISGWQGTQVFPTKTGPFNLVASLNTTVLIEFCTA